MADPGSSLRRHVTRREVLKTIGGGAVMLGAGDLLAACGEIKGSSTANSGTLTIGYVEVDWSAEHWSQGGMIGRFPTGVLTSYGAALHQPANRIHFAGTERATLFHGLMEGAVRSGEETARTVVDLLNA